MFIYLITNLVNGKYYVGQTIRDCPRKRFRQHCIDARRGSPSSLHRAMREFGVEKFTFVVVETASDKKQLDVFEKLWIEKLDSMNPSVGYNRCSGGSGWDKSTAAVLSVAFSGAGNPFYGKMHTSVSKDKVSQTKLSQHWVPDEAWLQAQRARTGSKNPMFGRKLSDASRAKMRARWAERRALGLKMNLSEEARNTRKQQAAAMRHTLQIKRRDAQNGLA